MNKRCLGCGKVLQSKRVNEGGYTPDLKNTYCVRCFRLKNYGEKKNDEVIDNLTLLKEINQKKGLVFFLIDYLNINKETISYFKKIKLSKVLIISKCDVLRKDFKFLKIKKWLKEVYDIKEDIFFLSSFNNYLSNNLIKYAKSLDFNSCYITGITNAGKSTFMNKMLKEYDLNKELLVSDMENTTLDFIKFKIDDIYIYDTPGFNYGNLNNNLVKQEIKPISFKITKPITFKVLDNYFYFDKPKKITFYLAIPKVLKEYKACKGEAINIKANEDLIIPGLGFINIKEACEVISNLTNLETRLDISEVNNE